MTRKQFLKHFPYLQRNDKRILLNVVRCYGGTLSYYKFFGLLYMGLQHGLRFIDAINFVNEVMSA